MQYILVTHTHTYTDMEWNLVRRHFYFTVLQSGILSYFIKWIGLRYLSILKHCMKEILQETPVVSFGKWTNNTRYTNTEASTQIEPSGTRALDCQNVRDGKLKAWDQHNVCPCHIEIAAYFCNFEELTGKQIAVLNLYLWKLAIYSMHIWTTYSSQLETETNFSYVSPTCNSSS